MQPALCCRTPAPGGEKDGGSADWTLRHSDTLSGAMLIFQQILCLECQLTLFLHVQELRTDSASSPDQDASDLENAGAAQRQIICARR